MIDENDSQRTPKLEIEMDEVSSRGEAIHYATAPPDERRSDEEAFGALVIAVKTAMSQRDREESNDPPTFTFTDGRGVLAKGGHNRVIFYLNEGYLIAKMPPLPAPLVVTYVRDPKGKMLSWYQFSLKNERYTEFQMAEQLIAILY